MKTICELCSKKKVKPPKEETVKLNAMLGSEEKIFSFDETSLYTCQCPSFYFDELIFVRDNNIELKEMYKYDVQALYSLFRDKKTILEGMASKKPVEDKFDAMQQAASEFNRFWTSEHEIYEQIRTLHTNIWNLLYRFQYKTNKELRK